MWVVQESGNGTMVDKQHLKERLSTIPNSLVAMSVVPCQWCVPGSYIGPRLHINLDLFIYD